MEYVSSSTDFVQRFPAELAFHVFTYLSHSDVVMCMLVSKRWCSLAAHPFLWRHLYVQKCWGMNQECIWRCEAWAQREMQRLKDWMVEHPQVKLVDIENALIGDDPFRPSHIKLLSGTEVVLNWKFLYHQRYQLHKNWEKGNYVCYTIPRAHAIVDSNGMHNDGIYCIQFDKNWVVSGSKDKTIRIWDIHMGECRKILRGHHASVLTLQFDVSMNLVISGSSDTLVIIWNLRSGEICSIYRGHTDSVLGLCFDAKHIVTCSKDCTIRVWLHIDHEKDNKPHILHILRGHRAAVNAVQLKGDRVVSASGDRTIKIWDLPSGVCLHTILGHQRGIACLQFDGRCIVSGSSDRLIRLFDAESGEVLHTFEGHVDLVRTVCYDSRKIISGSYDGTIRIWDICSGKMLHKINNKYASRIHRIVFDDVRIISCGQKRQIMVYDFGQDVDTTFF